MAALRPEFADEGIQRLLWKICTNQGGPYRPEISAGIQPLLVAILGNQAFALDNGGGGPGGPINAEDVIYNHPDYPTVDDALDALLYVPTNITGISGGSNNEIGVTINNVNLAWSINKTVVSQSFNQGIGAIDPALRALNLTAQAITTNRTYTLTASDGTTPDSASTSVLFFNKRYWGVSADTDLDDAEVISLSSELATARQQTRVFDCSGGRYFHFAFPASFGTPTFRVGGLSFTDMVSVTRSFVNASGHAESYQLWRCGSIQTGSAITVEVL